MRKILFLLVLFVAIPAFAATITYNRVTTYTDDSSIPTSKVPLISYTGWYGPSPTGPWTKGTTVTDNLAINVSDPPPGTTWWYTVSAMLDGMESAKAVPASKTMPAQTPSPPPGCMVK